jgi:hypothetical protein
VARRERVLANAIEPVARRERMLATPFRASTVNARGAGAEERVSRRPGEAPAASQVAAPSEDVDGALRHPPRSQFADTLTDSNPTPVWLQTRVIFGVFLVGALLVYAPVMKSFFLSDDFFYLSQIVHLDWPGVLLLQPGVFRPLHVLTWLVDYRLWGLNPLGYHLTNIVSHGLTSVMVFIVAGQLFRRVLPWPAAGWAAALAGLVFLVHPSHTEAVSWIIGRHDVLATLFVLCAWYGYMQYRARPRAAYLAGSLGAFFIALLFKESPLSFPLVLLAYEAWLLLVGMLERVGLEWRWRGRDPDTGKCAIRSRPSAATGSVAAASAGSASASARGAASPFGLFALYVLVVGAYLLIRRMASGALVSEFESPFIHPSLAIFANLSATVFRSFLPYVPVQLLPESPKLGLTTVAVALAGVVGVGLAVFWVYTNVRRPTPVKLLVTFLAVALVVSAIPTLAFGRPSIIVSEGERYAYLPSVFTSMLVGLGVTVLAKSPAVRAAVAVLVLVFLGAFLELSNQNWRTAGELTQSILASVAAQPPPQAGSGDLALLVVPDDLNGAFVYRNGLPEALALFGPPSAPRVNVIGWAFLERADEPIAVDRIAPATYAVSLPSARGTLVPATGSVLPAGLTTTRVDLYRFDVTLERRTATGYYSRGEMHFGDLPQQ